MKRDREALEAATPSIRIYSWKNPSVTLGYSQSPDSELNTSECDRLGIEYSARPTGGGILFHAEDDVAVSLVLPPGDSRRLLRTTAENLRRALLRVGIPAEVSSEKGRGFSRFCATYPTTHEITVGGRKICGISQRKTRNAVLQQCAIFVNDIPGWMARSVKGNRPPSGTLSLKSLNSLAPSFHDLAGLLISHFSTH